MPRLYMAEDPSDVIMAQNRGIPYIKWTDGMDSLIKMLMIPTLKKMFPNIKWDKMFKSFEYIPVENKIIKVPGSKAGKPRTIKSNYDASAMLEAQLEHDRKRRYGAKPIKTKPKKFRRTVGIAKDVREFSGGIAKEDYSIQFDSVSIGEYVGDVSSSVNIDVLQELKLLPKFIGDITDCVKHNLSNRVYWTEGYNKKLGYPLGNFASRNELPNLIIIDVSASIPDGISATMLALADTLRSQLNADLIITGYRSGYYPCGCELPTPQTLREYYPRGNEFVQFNSILEKYIAGKEFGHVISFGDDDSPSRFRSYGDPDNAAMNGTRVHAVHNYHTWRNMWTGYAKWARDLQPDTVTFDTSWCNWICDTEEGD